jgi:hypothetical protein
MERAAEAVRLKQRLEVAEERQDFVSTVIGSPLHTFKHKGVKYQ